MPSNSKEYIRKNYPKYWGTEQSIRDRIKRNAARRIMVKKGLAKKGDGLEVDHKNGIAGGNGASNLRVINRIKNRILGQKKAMHSGRKKKYDTSGNK